MTRPHRHIIQRQVLEISTSDLRQARYWESQTDSLLAEVIAPALERCFGAIVPAGEHLVIERLEIDLGVFSAAQLRRELGERLSKAIRAALAQKLAQARSAPASGNTPGSLPAALEMSLPAPAGGSEPAVLLSKDDSLFEIFLFFLQNGYLPWWTASDTNPESDWPEGLKPDRMTRLFEQLRRSERSRARLAAQFSPDFIARLLLLPGGGAASLIACWQWLDRRGEALAIERSALRHHFWTLVVAESVRAKPEQLAPAALLAIIIGSLPGPLAHLRKDLYANLTEKKPAAAMPKPLLQALRLAARAQEAPAAPGGDLSLPPVTREATTPFAAQREDEQTGSSDLPQPKPAPREGERTRAQQLPPREPVFVPDAGLVLVHHFLPELFRSAGLTADDRFAAPESRTRAVYLLAFLAHGTTGIPEPRLLLPKLLCGMEWETPLPPAPLLRETEIQLAEDLLRAVTGHWKALGDTSPDGLREAFIRRSGKLTAGPQKNILEVERKAQDILLNRLPWGYSIVKLPWMPGMLRVSWV